MLFHLFFLSNTTRTGPNRLQPTEPAGPWGCPDRSKKSHQRKEVAPPASRNSPRSEPGGKPAKQQLTARPRGSAGARPAGPAAPSRFRAAPPGAFLLRSPPYFFCRATINSPRFPSGMKAQRRGSPAGAPRRGGAAASRPAEPFPLAAPRQLGERVRCWDTPLSRRGPSQGAAFPQPPAGCPVPPRQRRAFV